MKTCHNRLSIKSNNAFDLLLQMDRSQALSLKYMNDNNSYNNIIKQLDLKSKTPKIDSLIRQKYLSPAVMASGRKVLQQFSNKYGKQTNDKIKHTSLSILFSIKTKQNQSKPSQKSRSKTNSNKKDSLKALFPVCIFNQKKKDFKNNYIENNQKLLKQRKYLFGSLKRSELMTHLNRSNLTKTINLQSYQISQLKYRVKNELQRLNQKQLTESNEKENIKNPSKDKNKSNYIKTFNNLNLNSHSNGFGGMNQNSTMSNLFGQKTMPYIKSKMNLDKINFQQNCIQQNKNQSLFRKNTQIKKINIQGVKYLQNFINSIQI